MMRSLGTLADMTVCADDIFSLGIHREKKTAANHQKQTVCMNVCVDYNEELTNIFFLTLTSTQ